MVSYVAQLLNVSSELLPLFDEKLLVTRFQSPDGNLCFHGSCKYFCDTAHPVCGSPQVLEVSACFFIPYTVWTRALVRHPWRRSYHKRELAFWETQQGNKSHCTKLRTDPQYDPFRGTHSKRLLHLIDISILDFLIANMDRHHFEYILELGQDPNLIMLDNGKGFAKSSRNELSILAPLFQCCLLRRSTWEKLLLLQNGPVRLSGLLERALEGEFAHMRSSPLFAASDHSRTQHSLHSQQTLQPLQQLETQQILHPKHLQALDDRLQRIVRVVNEDCVRNRGLPLDRILIDDGL